VEIIIKDTDLKKLSQQARMEIINLILSKGSHDTMEEEIKLKPHQKAEIPPSIVLGDEQVHEPSLDSDGLYSMAPKMAKEFLIGCSKTTRAFLEVFVKNDGIGHVDLLLEAIADERYKTKRDLNGVLAGITRRLRKLSKVPNASLLDWEYDDNENNKHGGYWRISKTTYNTLKEYFGD
jgi:hypothetical protein